MNEIRILCYNIHGGYDRHGNRDLYRLNNLLDQYKIDIGVFQEMETRHHRGGTVDDVRILAGADRPYHLEGPTLLHDNGWYGNLIVSNAPFIATQIYDLDTRRMFEPRGAIEATIDTAALGPVRILGTHLSLPPWERLSEVKNLLKLAEKAEETTPCPLLLMGDMNEWIWNAKLLRHLDKLMQPVPTAKTFPAHFPLLRLDRVWADAQGLEINAQVIRDDITCYLSDHLPILITLRKPSAS